MTLEADLLRQITPAGPDHAVQCAEHFLRTHAEWAESLGVRQWEALRRLAPDARTYSELSGAFEKYLKVAAERAGDDKKRWKAADQVEALRQAFIEGSQPDASKLAKYYQAKRQALGDRDLKKDVEQRARLRLGRNFLEALAVSVICRLAERDNG